MFSRHSIFRSIAAILVGGSALVGTVAAAGSAQAAPAYYPDGTGSYLPLSPSDYGSWGYSDGYSPDAASGQVVSPVPLNVRSGPSTAYWTNETIPNGTVISVSCKTDGTDVGGNYRWYQLADGQGWVSAYYVNNFDYVPWCSN